MPTYRNKYVTILYLFFYNLSLFIYYFSEKIILQIFHFLFLKVGIKHLHSNRIYYIEVKKLYIKYKNT